MQDKIIQIIFDKDDITWQTMVQELVKSEEMDPWNINLGVIAEKFLQMVRQLKEMDFRISGKVILAAAILLKIKAIKLVRDDVSDFDKLLIATDEMSEEEFYEELEAEQQVMSEVPEGEEFKLIPRTPQPRKRKVSVYDLVSALQRALEVKHRRVMREIPEIKLHLPEHHVDIDIIITKLYDRIHAYLYQREKGKLKFSQLVPSEERIDKVMTFIPLLHLTSQRKIDLFQEIHFGDIDITLAVVKPTDLSISEEDIIANQEKEAKEDAEEEVREKKEKKEMRAKAKKTKAKSAGKNKEKKNTDENINKITGENMDETASEITNENQQENKS